MIYDPASEMIVGNIGWVDHGSLWTYSVSTQTETRLPIKGTRFLGLRQGNGGLFRLTHHCSPDRAISIRHCATPDRELASIRFNGAHYRFSGDTTLWAQVDASVLIHDGEHRWLYLIDAFREKVTPLDLSWFNAVNYDLGYQDLVDCLTVHDLGRVLVAVQRSSQLVSISLETNKRIGNIMLASRGGNPKLAPLPGTEILASDYDSLCVVDLRTAAVRHSPPLQGPRLPNTQQFIGDYHISSGQCVVARPYSGDVVQVDLRDFSILRHAPVSGQPLDVCTVSEERVVTRDWKTGKVGIATLSPLDA